MLGINELEELLDSIRAKVILANRTGGLEELLTKWGELDLIEPQSEYAFETYKEGKIAVIGAFEGDERILSAICKDLGVDKNRLECCLDYKAMQKFDISKMGFNPNYRVILVGAMPHSGVGKGDSGSMIAEMENNKAYPRVVRLMAGNELKITKTSFKKAIGDLVAENYI